MDEGAQQEREPLSNQSGRIEKARRRRRTFGAALGLTAVGTFLPGSGLFAAGRRKIGLTILALFLVGAGYAAYLVLAGQRTILHWVVQPGALVVISVVLGAVALAWMCVIVATYRSLRPRSLRWSQQGLGYGLVLVLAAVAVTPLAVGGKYAMVQKSLVEKVFASPQSKSATRPVRASAADPWAGQDRVNVLLLGGDGGPDRMGIRTDTVIVASIDTKTGNTVMFSLPRNLENIPFPAGSPLADVYPNGRFAGGPDSDPLEWMLNAVYLNVPRQHPGVLDSDNPGADATKLAASGAVGLKLDYYVLVNLKGFRQLVDALGGITVNVNTRVSIGGETDRNLPPAGWIEPGPNQHLNGAMALWFARGRYGSDDWQRMLRQRCAIDAIVRQADPVKLLTRYEALARVTKDIVMTDIPQGVLPAFVDLSLKVKDANITSIAFTNEIIKSADPDYDLIHSRVQAALKASEEGRTSANVADSLEDACAWKGGPTGTPAPVPTIKPAPVNDPASKPAPANQSATR
ncbi:LCP family protein [Actinopolymorpha sp. NPDC004070]|uniref:LCP family protein n=1 Tax=Actinopolymorpha sp. NPDC004070 TaxID=3154548 RepID=UPI0033BC7441